jgi:hypothetical protein
MLDWYSQILEGPLEVSIFWKELWQLHVQHIPSPYPYLHYLVYFLSYTKILGDVPFKLNNRKELAYLHVNNNKLTGMVPLELG